MALVPSCFAIMVMMTAWPVQRPSHLGLIDLANITVDPFGLHNYTLGNLTLANLSVGATQTSGLLFNYTAQQTVVKLPSASTLEVNGTLQLTWINELADFGDLSLPFSLGVGLSSGVANVQSTLEEGTCVPASLAVAQCSIDPEVTLRFLKPPPGKLVGMVERLVEQIVANVTQDLKRTCGGLTRLLTNLARKADARGLVPPAVLPPAPKGSCNLQRNALARAAINIVQNLPILFGLRLELEFISTNAMRLAVDAVDVPTKPLTLGEDFSIFIPPGTTLSLDVSCGNTSCPAENSFTLTSSFKILNLRLTRHDGVPSPLDVFFSQDIANVAGEVVTDLARKLIGEASGVLTFRMPERHGAAMPNFYAQAVVGCVVTILVLAAMGYNHFRHRRLVVIGKNGEVIGPTRRLVDDCILFIGCGIAAFLFSWSNQTTAAWLKLGGEIDMYAFGLADTIADSWNAGLYPLSIGVATFCAFYPYFKLLCIAFIGGILQRPQNRLLQTIDALGKFSFLDTFIMILMVEGLTIPGLATVTIGASMWLFLAATIMSVALGNFATEGWRREVRPDPCESYPAIVGVPTLDQGPRVGSYTSLVDFDNQYVPGVEAGHPASSRHRALSWLRQDASSPHKFRPAVAVVLLVLLLVTLSVPLFATTIVYEFSGVASLITGATRPHSLMGLFQAAPLPLAIAAVGMAFVAPILFAAGYPRTRLLSAWASTDVLIVSVLVSLLQIRAYTGFVMGNIGLGGMVQIDCRFGWPIYFLGIAALIQVGMIVYVIVTHKRMIPHESHSLLLSS